MKTVDDLKEGTIQRIKVLEALGYVLEVDGASARQVNEALDGLQKKLDGLNKKEDGEIRGIVVLPLGYDNKHSFCPLYNIYIMPVKQE